MKGTKSKKRKAFVRLPVLNEHPTCFGTYGADDEICEECDSRRACDIETPMKFEALAKQTLAYQASGIEQNAIASTYDAESGTFEYGDLYAKLLEKHFHRKLPRSRMIQITKQITRLAGWCIDQQIDFATFVEANMVGMKRGMERNPALKKIGFQPNMLMGDKAHVRYRVFLQYNQNMTNNAGTVSDQVVDTDWTNEAYLIERNYGTELFAALRRRLPVEVTPPKTNRLSRLRAMASVVDAIIPNASESLIVPHNLSWADLSAFLMPLLPRLDRRPKRGSVILRHW